MKKCERCGTEAHHVHHKDRNHKNNKPDNLERLCTLCHAKEHGTEPKLSELKKLVTYFTKTQKIRIAVQNSILGFGRIELEIPTDIQKQLDELVKLEKKYEKRIKKFFKENPSEIHSWMTSIKGISDLLAGKFLSQIDFNNTPKEASLWKYAGLAPDDKRKKGKKADWNHELKSYCFQLVDSFIKQRTPKYREIYDKEKEKQLVNGLKRGHAHNRAIRKTAKNFLRDLFRRQKEI